VGSPTINGSQVGGLSNTNYLQQTAVTGGTPWFSNTNWELGLKVDNSATSGQHILNTRGSGGVRGILLTRGSSGTWYVYISTNGSSWAAQGDICSIPTAVGSFTWLKLSASSGTITVAYSYDGANFTTGRTLSNGNPKTTTRAMGMTIRTDCAKYLNGSVSGNRLRSCALPCNKRSIKI
jgi:hypothetical protein